MDIKDAVRLAVRHVVELFEQEQVSNVGLEEVSFDYQDDEWVVTVGFSRPWDYPARGALSALSEPAPPRRSFKVVRINGTSGQVISIRNRPVD